MDNPSEKLERFLSFFRDVEQQYHMAQADEQEANDATQDILHSLELEEHDYRDYARLSKELRQVRQRRRRAKDTLAQTLPILEWIDANRPVIKELERLLGAVRKSEKSNKNRIYTPRAKDTKRNPAQ